MPKENRKDKIKKLEQSIKKRDKRLGELERSRFSKGDINRTPSKRSATARAEHEGDALFRSNKEGVLKRTVVKPILDITERLKENKNRKTRI